LGIRPDLTWRDVQHIIRATADRIDLTTSDIGWGEPWFQNGVGIWYSYQHGFGRINAGNAVSLAKSWSLVGPIAGNISIIPLLFMDYIYLGDVYL
jgi:hypothetical protein